VENNPIAIGSCTPALDKQATEWFSGTENLFIKGKSPQRTAEEERNAETSSVVLIAPACRQAGLWSSVAKNYLY